MGNGIGVAHDPSGAKESTRHLPVQVRREEYESNPMAIA